jgi:hypothetical protein
MITITPLNPSEIIPVKIVKNDGYRGLTDSKELSGKC